MGPPPLVNDDNDQILFPLLVTQDTILKMVVSVGEGDMIL